MSGARILVVEDEAIIAKEIERSLQNLGYEVTSIVNSGDGAIEKAEEDKPDIVLMDIRIQGTKDGIKAAEIIRDMSDVPIIFSTAYLDVDRIERAKIGMPFGYVLKPIQERDLKVTLEMARYVAKIDVERRRAIQNLDEQVEFLDSIVEQSNFAMWISDTKGTLVKSNHRLREILGRTNEQLIGKYNIFEDQNLTNEQLVEIRKVFELHEPFKMEIFWEGTNLDQIHSKSSLGIWIEASLFPIVDKTGNLKNVVCQWIDITEQKQSGQDLKNSEEKYRNLVENSIQGMVIAQDDPLRLSYVSQPMQNICGYTPDDMMSFGPAELTELIHPSDRERFFSNFKKRLSGQTVEQRAEYRLICKDKSTRHIELYSSLISMDGANATQTVFYDITERKLAEEALKESKRKFRDISNMLPLTIFQTDRLGNFEFVNKKGFETFGYLPDDVSQGALHLNQIVVEEDLNRVTNDMREVFDRKGKELGWTNYTARKKDGSKVSVSVLSTHIENEKGEVTGIRGVLIDVSSQKLIEEALRESEQQLQAIFSNAPAIMILMNENTEVLKMNQAGLAAAGKEAGEEVRCQAGDILNCVTSVNDPNGCGYSEDCKACTVRNTVEKTLVTNENFHEVEAELDLIINGKPVKFSVLVSTTIIEPESPKVALITINDISDRKRAEDAIKKSEEKYRDVVENATIAICVLQNRQFKFFNAKAIELFGYTEEEMKQLNTDDTIYPEDLPLVIESRRKRMNGEKVLDYSHRIVTKSSEIRWIDRKAVTISWENEPAILVFYTDITDRKNTEEMMIQSEKMVSLGGLTAGVAHELNNPLGGMMLGVQNIQRRLSPELSKNAEVAEEVGVDLRKLQDYLEKREILSMLDGIRNSGKKATEIITNMLQFSRKTESSLAPTDLAAVMDKALDLASKDYDIRKKYDFRNIAIKKEFEPNLTETPCTETQIEQVILNLLKNAVWAASKSEKDIASFQIILRLKRVENMMQIEVEDNGPGMDETTRKRVFEPFYTTKPVGEGTGLGLSVSYMIITNNHRGTMEVESELGEGTKFIIRIPMERE